jgi:anti-sigma B factor antagonist
MALEINEWETRGVKILELTGRVTLGPDSGKLRSAIKEALGQNDAQLVLDLGQVSYIDSAGLGTLVAGFTTARNQGGNMKLANLTNKFHEQLNITKLVTVFDVYDSVDEAVASFH